MSSQQASSLLEVDELEFQFLIDNAVDALSTPPKSDLIPECIEVTSAWAHQIRFGTMAQFGGDLFCCAQHGLAIRITAKKGTLERTMVMDFGPDGGTLMDNIKKLAYDVKKTDGMMLSHGHFDHANGAERFLEAYRKEISSKSDMERDSADCSGNDTVSKRTPIPYFLNEDMLVSRAGGFPNGKFFPMDDVLEKDEIIEYSDGLVVPVDTGNTECTVLDNLFYISGQIPRITPFETGIGPMHFKWKNRSKTHKPKFVTSVAEINNKDNWEPDPLLLDERFLLVHVKHRGLVIFTSCSHAGAVNVCHEAKRAFPEIPIFAVVGGFHLSGGLGETVIEETVEGLYDLCLGQNSNLRRCIGREGSVGKDNAYVEEPAHSHLEYEKHAHNTKKTLAALSGLPDFGSAVTNQNTTSSDENTHIESQRPAYSEFGLLVPSHCTGYRANFALFEKFGDGHVALGATGKKFCFRS